MFPLAMHKGAREQCVAVICDKKSFEDLEGGYKSDNQCAEGAKQVDETIALLSGKGITGTPAYIFPDGRFQSGALDANGLRQRLGLPVQAAPPGEQPPPPPPGGATPPPPPPKAPPKKP
jgi:thiol:disulfide interchange protein DsbC